AVPMLRQQEQARYVRRESNATHNEDDGADRLAPDDEPANHVRQHADTEQELEHTAPEGGPAADARAAPDGVEADRVDAGVGEHVERVGSEAGRASEQPG